jgi:CBS domain-containing membrane protein
MNLIPVDPVNLSLKGKLLSVISCFIVILMITWVSQQFALTPAYPMLIASMGASAVILFIIPNSPLAQPWPLVGGQLVSTAIGVASAQLVTDTAFASAYAVGGSVLAMLLLRCLHPPGAAAALAPVLGGHPITTLGYGFVLMPVGLNVAVMLMMAIVINRLLLRHEYPAGSRQLSVRKKNNHLVIVEPAQLTGISVQDVEQALHNRDTFMDISSGDLSKLLTDVQKHRFEKFSGQITCGDIMVSNVLSVEYGTDVEEAWNIMQHENLIAIPVIDRSRRVIGILTAHDFFKFINVIDNETFQEKFLAFIRRTPDVSTNKPESVGHIMSSPVTVLAENTHITDLIPLMSDQSYRQIPIINNENRLVGMVYQASLIAALYNERQNHKNIKLNTLGTTK